MQDDKRLELEVATTTLEGLFSLAPAEAAQRVAVITEALPTCGDPAVLVGIARSLPERVTALAPEVCLALQQLAMALAPYGPRLAKDVPELDPRLQVEWLRVGLTAGDHSCLTDIDETLLLYVVTGWSPDSVLSPLPLLSHLARASDARLRAFVLRWLRPAVLHLAITPRDAFTCLEPLLEDVEGRIRRRALGLLSQCWLLGLKPAFQRRREQALGSALMSDDHQVARAAVIAATELDVRHLLADALSDENIAATTRAEVLAALGRFAQPPILETVFALATREPLRFGPPARLFLLDAHRHGVFLRDQHLEPVLQLFDDHTSWTGEELVRVTYIVRTGLVERLAELPAHDSRWLRRASILAASVGTGAHRLLGELLERAEDVLVASALVEAAGRSPEYVGEGPLLCWLEVIPEVVIPVLRVKGGPDTAMRLRALVLDPFCERALRTLAMGVLWAQCDDRAALLRELGKRLGPHESGLLNSVRASARDDRVAAVLLEAPWEDAKHHSVDPIVALGALCESGEIRFLPEVIRLFREVFVGYVRSALAGDFTIKRLLMPDLEQKLFRYGRHLVNDGRCVRRWLDDGPETGRDLVLLVACDWLQESPANPVSVALLEMVGRHSPSGAVLRFIEPFWRHRDRAVQRAAIEAILEAGEEARGLEVSLCKLADAKDPRILCQALAAVETLGAHWAEPIVLATLRRPEMAVKKQAAEALVAVGSNKAVPTLVEWLAHHDNSSFRRGLLGALKKAAGASLVAVLVDALDGEQDARRKDLLWQALSGQISRYAVSRLARSSRPAHRELVEACLEGRVEVADASSDELAEMLHRARLLPREPFDDPGRRLRIEGFSAGAASEVVAERDPKLDHRILPIVRSSLADWITWIASGECPHNIRVEATMLVLDAASGQHAEHYGALLSCVERDIAYARDRDGESAREGDGARAESLEPATVAAFFKRCLVGNGVTKRDQIRAIEILRSLAPSSVLGGLRRYRLLGKLGAVRTRPDLEMCLAECRIGPDLASDTATLLCEVFQIPAAKTDEPPETTALRDGARQWYQQAAKQQGQWLTATLNAFPLDLPVPAPPPEPPGRAPFSGDSREDLDTLLTTMKEGDAQERARSARRILDWSDSRPEWDEVLRAFLSGRVDLDAEYLGRLAPLLTSWPTEKPQRKRAATLVAHLSEHQLRMFTKSWIAGWDEGDADMAELLQSAPRGQDRLLPVVYARAQREEYRLARLLRRVYYPSLALRLVIDLVGAKAPEEIEHLLAKDDEAATDGDAGQPVDPIAGKEPAALAAIIKQRGVAKGLAVRAVHVLAAYGDRGVDPLEELTTDRRPAVRSAALRALRRVAPRERTLLATARVLEMETRRDVALGLMSSLSHGRYEPALPALIKRLTHNDERIRQGAHAAIRAWGSDAVPALRHASRRARPDRRPTYTALIEELE